MKFLIFDTTRENLSVFLFNENFIDEIHSEKNFKSHNKNILLFVEDLLSRNGLDFSEIDFFATNVGPGSFTGIRLGIATLNAFHISTRKPLIEYNVFEPIGYFSNKKVEIAINSIQDKYYYAEYENKTLIDIGEKDKSKLSKDAIILDKSSISENEIIKTVSLVIQKYQTRQFKTQLAPLYLKKSQAEKEYDSKN